MVGWICVDHELMEGLLHVFDDDDCWIVALIVERIFDGVCL